MQLASYLDRGRERLGVASGGRLVPVEALLPGGPLTMGQLLEGGPAALEALRTAWDGTTGGVGASESGESGDRVGAGVGDEGAAMALDDVRMLSPVPRPGKIVAIGLNYHGHAREQGAPTPERPIIFAKFSTSVIGAGEDIEWDPRLTEAVDFEAELAVVIGRTTRRVAVDDALRHVFGYTCLNDVSARDLQYSDRQFVRAKSLDTFCPMGPVLVTADEIADPQTLAISCTVNGERLQDSTTGDMVFGVAQLVSFCSQAFTLEPGDVIATGTPAGVGYFRDPRRLLRDGDEVVVEIERVGRLINRCREVAAAG